MPYSAAGPRWTPSHGVVASEKETAETLTALVDHSLVRQSADQRGEVRFDILHIIREYARDLLDGSPDAPKVRDRHARYYLALAEAVGPGGGDDTFGGELDNLRAALGTLLDRAGGGDSEAAELGLRLANTLGQFWYRHCHVQEGISMFERSLEVAPDVDELRRATALRHLGTLLETRRDVDAARPVSRRRSPRTGVVATGKVRPSA